MIGNLYGVGTYDLRVFLITSDEGHILINTGLADSTALIRGNMVALGCRLEDVDVWVAAHGSQDGLHDKYAPGQAYSPDTFVDPEGFVAAVARLETVYREQLAEVRGR